MTITSNNSPIDLLCRLIAGHVDPHAIEDTAWPGLVALARQHRAAPLLAWQLGQAGLANWRDAHYPALTSAMRRAAPYWLILESVRDTVDKILTDAHIPILWLKGIALAPVVYPLPWLRPMGDIDALVAPDQFQEALRLLAKNTGQPVALLSETTVTMHAAMMLGPRQTVKLELHHSLLDAPVSRLAGDANWFLGRGHWVSTPRGRFYVLRPEAHLAYLAAHAILQHGEGDFQLLRYLDLHMLVTHTPDLDWERVVEHSVNLGWTYAVERALSISQQLFATSLPDDLLAELQARRRADEDVSIAVRKQQDGNRWQRTLHRFAAMSWQARLRVAVGLAFPAPAYMRWRYRIKHGWQTPFYYPYRWLDVAAEVVKTVGKSVGR